MSHSVFALAKLLSLAKHFEGLRLSAYTDRAGVLTIGYGHTGPDVYEGQVITEEEAERLLLQDAECAMAATLELCPSLAEPSAAAKRAAIADFTFNLGAGRLRASTLRRRINDGDWAAVPGELRRWVYASVDGKPVKLGGLIKRREAEVALWELPFYADRSRPSTDEGV